MVSKGRFDGLQYGTLSDTKKLIELFVNKVNVFSYRACVIFNFHPDLIPYETFDIKTDCLHSEKQEENDESPSDEDELTYKMKVSTLVGGYCGGGGGNRTPVRKSIHTAFSGRRRPINFPLSAGERRPAGEVASLVHDRPQSLRRYTFTAVSRRVPDRSPSGHDGYRLSGNCKFIVICVYF